MALNIALLIVLFAAVLFLIASEINLTRSNRLLAEEREMYDFDVAIPMEELREELERATMTWDWPRFPHANIEGLLDGSCVRIKGKTVRQSHLRGYGLLTVEIVANLVNFERAMLRVQEATTMTRFPW